MSNSDTGQKNKVKRKEYNWRKTEFDPPDIPFCESADEASEESLSLHLTCILNSWLLMKWYSLLQIKQISTVYRKKEDQ